MEERNRFPYINPEEVKLRAAALDTGHLKLATWGTKQDIQHFLETNKDRFRGELCQ